MGAISIKQLLEAGVHFGHQTRRWNPKMKPFIFGKRNGVHIIDLQKTLQLFKEAVDFLTQLAAQGKTVLFVGTKSQAQETVEEEARRCGMYWVNNRWLGGLLTNFPTIQTSIKRYRELESMRENGHYEKLSKKEVARLERERKKLEKNLLGIKDIERCPDALFVVDSRQETIAIREAAKLKIPIVAIVDTNSDPDLIDYLIPGNDDALRAIKLFAGTMADAILAGKAVYSTRLEAEMKEAQEKADKIAKEAAQRQAAKEAKEAAQHAAQHAAEGKEAVETGAVPAEEQVGEEKRSEAAEIATAGATAVAVPVAALPVEESTGVKPAPAQEMKEEEKKEEKKEVPKRKTLAKKAKSETEKSKSIQAAKEKKTKKKSEKSASKTRKTASAKSKSTKSPAKSKTRKETTSKDSSASSGSSS
ncbi:MAG: 30S ribosomal protein S2 [Acidobacteria bacterium]|nr:MAG: 30S ribosomal protein S2 [Acidobacteriota bacterium]